MVSYKESSMDPTPLVTSLITEWYSLTKEIEAFKEKQMKREMELRRLLVAALFQTPAEGTQYEDMPAGWRLKLQYKIDRKVDEAALPAVKDRLREIGVNPDLYVVNKPELSLTSYRLLTEEQRQILDQALIIKPASPTLELVPPKPA
jgi:hypothetical protein